MTESVEEYLKRKGLTHADVTVAPGETGYNEKIGKSPFAVRNPKRGQKGAERYFRKGLNK